MLALLAGGTLFLALHVLWSPQAAQVAGLLIATAVIVQVALDGLQSAHDRATAFRRWRRWHG